MSKKKAPEPSLPSVDSVLNKLKSDGTFDQFRRTCLGYIQGEVGGLTDKRDSVLACVSLAAIFQVV